jgi:hypothetical protein
MTIASTGTRVRWASLVTGILVASAAWVTVMCPAAAAGRVEKETLLEDPSAYVLIPAQLSAPRTMPPNAPAMRKRLSAPAKTADGLTPEEYKRLAEAINSMTPKERKRLAKAMKHLTPEGRRQLAEVVKRGLAGKGPVSQLTKHAR